MQPVVCPWCGSKDTAAEFVDIGVGMQQVTPRECGACGAREFNYHTELREIEDASPLEKKSGWWCGWEHRDSLAPLAPPSTPRVRCRECNSMTRSIAEQEKKFKQAKEDFEKAAARVMGENTQLKNVVAQLRADIRDSQQLNQEWLQQSLAEKNLELNAVKDKLAATEKALADLKKDLRGPETPTGKHESRFTLLEID